MDFFKKIIGNNNKKEGEEPPKEKLTRDDFTDLAPLGKGSFAKVVLSISKKTNQLYALKVVDKQTILQQHRERDAFIERNILRRLENPYVLKLHATFQTDHKLFFVLDYCQGGDFDKYLLAQPAGAKNLAKALDYETTRLYAAEVFLALKCLHDGNILYRDLKPENLMMTARGHLNLADFGLSKDFGDAPQAPGSPPNTAQSFVGSPFYVSPDVLRQQKYDKSVDFWSFGILIFRMFYGTTPFTGRTMKEVFDAILTKPVAFPQPPAGVEDGVLKDLVLRLLERDPARRLKAEEIAAHPYWKDHNGLGPLSLADVQAVKVAPKNWVAPPLPSAAAAALGQAQQAGAPGGAAAASQAALDVTRTKDGAAAIGQKQQERFNDFTRQ